MLGLLTIVWEKKVEMDNKIERTYRRKALLHRQLSMKMEKPSFNCQLLFLFKIIWLQTPTICSLPE